MDRRLGHSQVKGNLIQIFHLLMHEFRILHALIQNLLSTLFLNLSLLLLPLIKFTFTPYSYHLQSEVLQRKVVINFIHAN